MASTYSTSLKLELIGNGDQSGVWGTTTNKNLGTLLEQAITGVQSIVMTNADYTLTNFNGTSDEARNAVLVVTGTNSASRKIITPLVEKTYIVYNNTTGGFAITIGGATGSVATIPNGVTTLVYCNGTNFFSGITGTAGNFVVSGNLGVGTTTPAVDLEVSSATGSATPTPTEIRIATSTSASDWSTSLPWGRLSYYSADASQGGAKIQASIDTIADSTNGGISSLVFNTAATTGTLTERMQINSAGAVAIGGSTASSVNLYLRRNITGSTTSYGIFNIGTVQPDVTAAYYFRSDSSTASNAGTPYTIESVIHYGAIQDTFNANSTVTNQYGFLVSSSLTDATNNYGYFSSLASGTGRWNFYAGGTADNYFAGDVGIGVTTPNTKLEIAGSTEPTVSFTASISGTTMTVTAISSGTLAPGQYIFNSTISPNTYIISQLSGTTGSTGTYSVSISQTVASATSSAIGGITNRVRITDTDTSVVAGQPIGTLEWFGSDSSTPGSSVKGFVQVLNEDATPDAAMVFGTYDGGVGTSASERMRITSGGNLLVNKTASNFALNGFEYLPSSNILRSTATSGVAMQLQRRTTIGSVAGFFYNGTQVGSIDVTESATSYVTSSDYRLKENIAPMAGALNVVQQLKPVTYKWKVDGSASQGFIAHELQEIVPECVVGEKDAVDVEGNPQYQGVDTSFLVATLTAAIQELNAKVDAQALEIASLKK
jgi:hypothetical protein